MCHALARLGFIVAYLICVGHGRRLQTRCKRTQRSRHKGTANFHSLATLKHLKSSKDVGISKALTGFEKAFVPSNRSVLGWQINQYGRSFAPNSPSVSYAKLKPSFSMRRSSTFQTTANGGNSRREAWKTAALIGGLSLGYATQKIMNRVPPYLQLYRENLDVNGEKMWAAQNWASRQAQTTRFAVLVDEINFEGQSVLDVGCGQGDFARYLETRGEVPSLLRGIDGIPEFVKEAQLTAPPWAEYAVRDPLVDRSALGLGWDWVILSGVIVNFTPDQAKGLLEDCWRVARRGIAFNFLSTREYLKNGPGGTVELENGKLRAYRPEDLVEWAEAAGADVRLLQDYLGKKDATIIMRRKNVGIPPAPTGRPAPLVPARSSASTMQLPDAGAPATALDRSIFNTSFEVQALQVPARRTGEFVKQLSPYLLKRQGYHKVQKTSSGDTNLVLLSQNLDSISSLPLPEYEWVQEQVSKAEASLTKFTVRLSYDDHTAEELLRKLLPPDVEVPSSFEQAGHVCHLNLRDAHLPFRHLIAQVILDTHGYVKTVVNKVGKIEDEFRTFTMEHLAGDPSSLVRLSENRCVFEFEYRDVYWNSRLQGERQRLLDAFLLSQDGPKPELAGWSHRPMVADCTCGIGPFSVPAVKYGQGIVVHANDLNPKSIEWLAHNAKINKLPHVDRVDEIAAFGEEFSAPKNGSRLVIYESRDARDFVQGLFHGLHPVTHALFNLPAAGVELLDCFRGLRYADHGLPRPYVCCYAFSSAVSASPAEDGCVADLLQRLATALSVPLESLVFAGSQQDGRLPLTSPQILDMIRAVAVESSEDAKDRLEQRGIGRSIVVAIRLVRQVSPSRKMFCVCFQVPDYVQEDAELLMRS